jgi:hypothetical protein
MDDALKAQKKQTSGKRHRDVSMPHYPLRSALGRLWLACSPSKLSLF